METKTFYFRNSDRCVFSSFNFSVVIHFLEKDLQPEAFGNILDSMWYGIATLTTVGYGDVTPVSDLGKLFLVLQCF